MEGGGGGPGGNDNSFEALTKRGLQQVLPILLVMMAAATLMGAGRQDAQEVSFQWFKTHLLAKGVVEKLEVANKQMVKVYVRPATAGTRRTVGDAAGSAGEETMHGGSGSDAGEDAGFAPAPGIGGPLAGGVQGGVYKFYFNIGSVDSFEHAMEEAQEAMGVSPNRWEDVRRCCVWLGCLLLLRVEAPCAATAAQFTAC
jgi:AFG3 family protein